MIGPYLYSKPLQQGEVQRIKYVSVITQISREQKFALQRTW